MRCGFEMGMVELDMVVDLVVDGVDVVELVVFAVEATLELVPLRGSVLLAAPELVITLMLPQVPKLIHDPHSQNIAFLPRASQRVTAVFTPHSRNYSRNGPRSKNTISGLTPGSHVTTLAAVQNSQAQKVDCCASDLDTESCALVFIML